MSDLPTEPEDNFTCEENSLFKQALQDLVSDPRLAIPFLAADRHNNIIKLMYALAYHINHPEQFTGTEYHLQKVKLLDAVFQLDPKSYTEFVANSRPKPLAYIKN